MIITFQEDGHKYTLDRIPVPHITGVLEGVGITDYSKVPAYLLIPAQEFGSAVHLTTAYHDRGILRRDILDPKIVPYLEAWIKFKKDYNFRPAGIERRIGSKKYMFAGTLDRDGDITIKSKVRPAVVEIKTSFELDIAANTLQTAAQEIGLKETIGTRYIYDRYGVLLMPDASYDIEPHTNKTDGQIFLSALTTYNYKRRYNR